MSNHQPDDDPANDTDQTIDKFCSLENFSDSRVSTQGVRSDQKPTVELPWATKDEGFRKRSGLSLADPKGNDDDPRISGDICRICHMGGFPATEENRATRERQDQTVRRVDSQMSTLSSYSYLGPLISACKCRGTVALVHAECLERWLTESGHTRCELCGYKYTTKRVPRHSIFRSIAIWFNTVIVTRQMLMDILYLIITTPLALFSCYICVLALKLLLKSGLHEMPWMIVAMLPTCSLTLVAYWGWIVTLGRLHGRRWRRYWRSNFVIRLVPDDAIQAESSVRIADSSVEYLNENSNNWRNDEAEEPIWRIGEAEEPIWRNDEAEEPIWRNDEAEEPTGIVDTVNPSI